MKKFIQKKIDIMNRYKLLVENYSYLSVLQLFNITIPLITYPYLIRVLGSETYGLIMFSQAIIGYFVILVSFGFNITGTKEISLHRDNNEKLSEIISSILIIKGSLLLLSFLILFLAAYFIPQIYEYKTLYYLTMWMAFYEFIFPVFYFQGIEKMKFITYVNVISRTIFLILIFVVINSKTDYLLVPIVNGVGTLCAGIISMFLVLNDGIKIKLQPINILLEYIKKSYTMALAYASNSFKTNLNIIIVKFLFSYSEVAYFDLALKISNIGIVFLDLISQTIFPKMSRDKSSLFLKKIIRLSMTVSFVIIIIIQIFASQIIYNLGGVDMEPAVNILRILIFFIPIYIFGALLGRNCLIVHGYDKQVLLSMLFSSIIYIFITYSLYVLGIDISITAITIIYIISFGFESIYRYKICRLKNIF